MADAQASGACGRKIVWVQVPSPALFFYIGKPLIQLGFPIFSCCERNNFLVTNGHVCFRQGFTGVRRWCDSAIA